MIEDRTVKVLSDGSKLIEHFYTEPEGTTGIYYSMELSIERRNELRQLSVWLSVPLSALVDDLIQQTVDNMRMTAYGPEEKATFES